MVAAKELLAASLPSEAEPMKVLDADVPEPKPIGNTVPAPQPPARPEYAEEGEIKPVEQDLREVITQFRAKKRKKNRKKK